MPARNANQEKEILQWIEAVMGEPVPSGDFAEVSNHRNLPSAKTICIRQEGLPGLPLGLPCARDIPRLLKC